MTAKPISEAISVCGIAVVKKEIKNSAAFTVRVKIAAMAGLSVIEEMNIPIAHSRHTNSACVSSAV